ncbi:MAG: DUF5060 domain-containing protein, partial [Planctomycetes bacterium]|nr:DUF5060 domain-containing protein [Planctomycetota bacterium]
MAFSSVLFAADTVGIWDRFEKSATNDTAYADPLRDVRLDVTYTRPDGKTVKFWGFWDGGSTWRIRYMPDMLGEWSYSATFSDGKAGTSGSFTCVESTIPGMVAADESNPIWLGYKGGKHGTFRAFHGGPPLFKTSFSDANRKAFLDWAQAQKYNLLSVNDFQGSGFPQRWPIDPANYRQIEGVLNDMANRRMVYFPFGGFFPNESEDRPSNDADATLLINYYTARFGPYWNILFNLAGFEAEKYLSYDKIRAYGTEVTA